MRSSCRLDICICSCALQELHRLQIAILTYQIQGNLSVVVLAIEICTVVKKSKLNVSESLYQLARCNGLYPFKIVFGVEIGAILDE